jgi:hypothetical protein
MAARAYNSAEASAQAKSPAAGPGFLMRTMPVGRAARERPGRTYRYFTLRFSADSLPRFATISYSIC